MKENIGELIILGIASFALTLTGISINQNELPAQATIESKQIDSISKDNKQKTSEIKMLLFQQSSEYRRDTTKSKKNRF